MKKNIFLEIFIILFFLITLTALIFILNIPAYNYFNSIKENLFLELESSTGFNIVYKKISPNIIGKIKIFEVILYKNNGTKLELGNIDISYSLFSLIFDRSDKLSFIKKISLRTFDLKLNKEDEFNNIKEIFNNIKNNNKSDNSFKINKLLVELPKGKVKVIDKDKEYIFQTSNLRINFNKDIKVKGIIDFYLIDNEEISFSTTIKTDGLVKKVDDVFLTIFNIDLIKTNFGYSELRTQRFVLESIDKDFRLTRLKDSLPIIFAIKKDENNIFTDINIQELEIKRLFIANKKSKLLPDILSIKSDLFFDLNFRKKEGNFSFYSHHDNLLFLKKFDIDIDLRIINNIVRLNRFFVSNINKNNHISLNGNIPLYNSNFKFLINVNDFLLPFSKINTSITVQKNNNEINIVSDKFKLNDIDIGNLSIKILDFKNYLTIKSTGDFNGYSIEGDVFKGKDNLKGKLKHTFNDFSISKFIRSYNKNDESNILMKGSLINEFTNKDFKIYNSSFDIFKEKKKLSFFNFDMTNNIFNLYNLRIEHEKKPTDIKGWIDFNELPVKLSFNMNRDKLDLKLFSIISKKIIQFSINNRLFAFIDMNENNIQFRANNFALPVRNSNTIFNFNFLYDLNTNSINYNRISINNAQIFNNKSGNISANFYLRNNILNIKNFIYKDDENKIIGQSLHEIGLGKDLSISGKGFFKDDKKEESYSIDYNIKESEINAKIYVTHFDIKKVVGNNLEGYINSRLNIYGKIKNPIVDLESDISEGKFKNNPLNSFFILRRDEHGIHVKKAILQIDENVISMDNSILTFNDDRSKKFFLNGSIHLEKLQKIIKSNFSINGDFTSFLKKESPINMNIKFKNMTIGYIKDFKIEKVEKLSTAIFNIERNNNIWTIKDPERKFVYIKKDIDNISVKLFQNEMTVLDSNVNIKDKNLKGIVKLQKFPVNAFQKILLPFVGIDEGLVEGNIELKGTIANPQFYGKLNIFYGVVTLPQYLSDPIINITGTLIADNNKFIAKNVNAEVRKGLAHGYGELLFNGWKLERYLFHLNSDLIPGYIKNGPVDANGFGYIEDFVFEGSPKNFNFIGNIVIESADINLESLMGLNKKRRKRKTPINAFFTFKSGKKVRVRYPIIKGVIKPEQIFTLKYFGEEPQIYIGGTIELSKGDLYYLDKIFKIESASFQFFEDEARVNPNVNLKAYFRTKDYDKEQIKIYLTMNDRLIPFKTKLSSFPNKTQEEINGLLGLSFAYKTEDNNLENDNIENNNDTASIESLVNTTNYLSNSFFFTPIENRIRKITTLDTFSMDTKVFGNIIKSDQEYYTSSLDLLDESSLTLGKYIFNELYFESMLSFNKKETISEQFFLPLNDQNYGLNLELMLQLEFPYLMIGYSFLPKDYTNFLDADHQISIEANFRF